VAWALANLGPQPMENFGQTPSAVAWRERPSTYVVCAEDMVVHPDLQAQLAKRCTQTYVWPTSHSPFASEPERLSRLLVELAEPVLD
jgi:pimeloyl-ACP methyl ester carboxylesterase